MGSNRRTTFGRQSRPCRFPTAESVTPITPEAIGAAVLPRAGVWPPAYGTFAVRRSGASRCWPDASTSQPRALAIPLSSESPRDPGAATRAGKVSSALARWRGAASLRKVRLPVLKRAKARYVRRPVRPSRTRCGGVADDPASNTSEDGTTYVPPSLHDERGLAGPRCHTVTSSRVMTDAMHVGTSCEGVSRVSKCG